MAQSQNTESPDDPVLAVLAFQVVETNSIGGRAVIAAFDLEADARFFAAHAQSSSHSYEVRPDPKGVAA